MYIWARLGAVGRPGKCAFYKILQLLFTIPVCHAILVNQTIDSNNGDPVTGFMPIYKPQSPWDDQTCSGCYIQPDPAKAYDGTWNAATYHPALQNVNFTLQFTGVAVWVFFILSNANKYGPGTTTNTQVNVTLDGRHAGTFSHNPDLTTQDLIYNASIFSASNLANTPHELVIATNDYPISTFINFDWAIYTVEQDAPPPPSQSPPSPTITTTTITTIAPSTSSSSTLTTTISTPTPIRSTSSPTSTHSTSSAAPTHSIVSSPSTHSTSSTTLDPQAPPSQSIFSTISGGFPSTTDSSSTITASSSTSTSQTLSPRTDIIVGCTLGGLATIALVLLFFVRHLLRVRSEMAGRMLVVAGVLPQPHERNVNPHTLVESNQSQPVRLQEAREMEMGERVQPARRQMDNLNSLRQPTRSEFASLRNVVHQLRDQVGTLQAQRETDLMLDSSNEPLPPAYTPDPSYS